MKPGLKQQIFDRDDWRCVRCLGAANDVHHRKLKGIGGSKLLDTPANLITYAGIVIHGFTLILPTPKLGFMVHSWDNPENMFIVTKLGVLTLREDGTANLQGSCEEYF